MLKIHSALFFFLCFLQWGNAQSKYSSRFYFSWGYNKEWYAVNNIHVNQSSLGNDYAFVKVKGTDKPGWDTGIFNKDLTIPQYNYRLGYKYNDKWCFELNFDHTKYEVPDQTLRIRGTYNGIQVDSSFLRMENNLTYQLNNGANFFLFNGVRRMNLFQTDSLKISLHLLLKGGIGFMYPHVENTIMGKNNAPHFQFGGLNAGTEAGVQAVFFKHFYLEYTNKLLYAVYRNLKIYEGTAKQNLACYEMILSAGIWF